MNYTIGKQPSFDFSTLFIATLVFPPNRWLFKVIFSRQIYVGQHICCFLMNDIFFYYSENLKFQRSKQ